MSDKTGYPLSLDISTSSIVNTGVALDSTYMFGAMFQENIGDSKTFSTANWTFKDKMLNGRRALILNT